MPRLVFATALLFAITAIVPAAPVPVVPQDATKDREGNPLPKGATARLGSLMFRGPAFYGLTFSPDGKKLRASEDGRVFIWDADTGKPLATKTFPVRAGGGVLLSGVAAGDRVIWIEHENRTRARPERCTVVAFELADGSELSRFQFAGDASFASGLQSSPVVASRDGHYLAVAATGEKAVEVYNVDNGKRLYSLKLEQPEGASVNISTDGKTLFVREYKKPIRRFDLRTGKELPALADTDHFVSGIDVSPDGKWLVTRSVVPSKEADPQPGFVRTLSGEKSLVVRDGTTGKPVGRLELPGEPLSFLFVGPDAIVVSAMDARFPLPTRYTQSRWNLATLKREWEVEAMGQPVLSPNGKRLVVTDRMFGASLWDPTTGKREFVSGGHAFGIVWAGFSPDGKTVTTADGSDVRTWTLNGEPKSVAELPELRRARLPPVFAEQLVWKTTAEDGKTAELVGWDREKGGVGWRMPFTADEHARVYSHDGKQVVVIGWNAVERIWQVTVHDGPTGKKLHAWALPKVSQAGPICGVPLALSGDGRLLFVGKDDVIGFDVQTGKEMIRAKEARVGTVPLVNRYLLAASHDGNRIAVADDKKLCVFDVQSDKKLAEHDLNQVYDPRMKFSPDSKRLAMWSAGRSAVIVFDTESSAVKPLVFDGSIGRPQYVVFSPDNTKLVVGYEDGTALVWDLTAK